MLRIRQLVLYRDEGKGLLDALCSLQDDIASLSADGELKETSRSRFTDRYSSLMQEMIEKAESYGFSGNVWHSFLTYVLVYHENAYSRACEIRGSIPGGLNRIAMHDFEIFRELFAYRFADIEDAFSDAGTGVKVIHVKILEHGFQPVQFILEGGSGHCGVVFTHIYASRFL